MVILDFAASGEVVGELDQLWWCRLHGERIFLGVEVLEGYGITDEDMGKLASQPSRGGDGLCLDTLANLELEAASAILGAFGDVDGDGLGILGVSRLDGLAGRRGRHSSRRWM